MLTIAMWIPIYDCVVVPFFRKLVGKEGSITFLQTIGIRIVHSILAMIVSCLVEVRGRSLAHLSNEANTKRRCHIIYVWLMANPSTCTCKAI
jgi:hypothetical protein